MFTQFVSTVATVYGVLAALKSLLQTRQMRLRTTGARIAGVIGAARVDMPQPSVDHRAHLSQEGGPHAGHTDHA